jgi:hypothetical protein
MGNPSVLSAVYAVLPDGHILVYYFGVQYGDIFGIRSFIYSLIHGLRVSMLAIILALQQAAGLNVCSSTS